MSTSKTRIKAPKPATGTKAPKPATNTARFANVVQEVRKRYGDVIDLRKSPAVFIEILRNYAILDDPPPDGGTGGVKASVNPGTVSTVAVGIDVGTVSPGTVSPGTVSPGSVFTGGVANEEILRSVLLLQKQVDAIGKQLSQLANTRILSKR